MISETAMMPEENLGLVVLTIRNAGQRHYAKQNFRRFR
jgi:hypothetical protein